MVNDGSTGATRLLRRGASLNRGPAGMLSAGRLPPYLGKLGPPYLPYHETPLGDLQPHPSDPTQDVELQLELRGSNDTL
jgi:hypothetical protein